MPTIQNRTSFYLLMILVFAITIRLIGVTSRQIWYDEAFSLLISNAGPSAVLESTLSMDTPSASADIHPPAYYFLLWGWIQLFGNGIVSARSLSILFGLGSIILTFLFAKDLINDRTALLAAFGVALLPFQIHYSVEIRMYSLLAFFLTLATFSFWKARKSGRFFWWVIFTIACALGQYTHNLAVFFLVPLAMTGLFMKEWKTVRCTLLAGLGAVLLYLPWLIQIPAQFSKVQTTYWVERPSIVSFVNLILIYVTNLPLPKNLLLAGLMISLSCVMLAMYQTFKAYKIRIPGYRIGLWLAYLSFTPPLLLWIFSQWIPVYVERALLASNTIFCIWLAWALLETSLPKVVRIFTIAILLIGAMMGLIQHLTYIGFPYAPYQAITLELSERSKSGDLILHSNKLSYLPALYYNPSLPQKFIIDEPGSKSDTLAPATREVLLLDEAADISSATKGVPRIWFIIFQKEIDEYITAGYSNHPYLQYLDKHFQLISSESWNDLHLFQYSSETQ